MAPREELIASAVSAPHSAMVPLSVANRSPGDLYDLPVYRMMTSIGADSGHSSPGSIGVVVPNREESCFSSIQEFDTRGS